MLLRILASVAIVLTSSWAVGALYFQHRAGFYLWPLFAIACIAFTFKSPSWRPVTAYALALGLLIIWWQTVRPSDTRDWADDVAKHLESTRHGDVVTLTNVRNFNWRSTTDYEPRWETHTYDLSRLESLDVACSYWMGPAIAHTLVSFGFADGRFLTFSFEIRKERDEQFSAVGGFFREFEGTLIAADENDIIKTRTNVRGEDVYLYRVDIPRQAIRELFEAYLDEVEKVRNAPRWYNTATANCTTLVYAMAKRIEPLPLDYRLLLSGYLPEYLFDNQALTKGYDFATLKAQGRVTDRARHATGDFSRAIREGMPGW